MTVRTFHMVIEKDENGWYVGSVVELPGCHTQARSVEDLRQRIREAIMTYLGPEGVIAGESVYAGLETVEV